MSWISKNLTLDLLAIAIDGLNKTFERIQAEPGEWPEDPDRAMEQAVSTAPLQVAPVEQSASVPVQQQPIPAQASAPATQQQPVAEQAPPATPAEDPAQPAPEGHPQLVEAQNALRQVAQKEGNTWITGELFPHFGTQSLFAIPLGKLPELVAMVNARAGLGATTA